MTFQRILVSAVMTALAACELDAGQAVSPLEITSATVTTNASSYVVGEPVTITWSGLPGNAFDWVEYLPVSGDDHNPTRWAYTGGVASGSVTLQGAPADGAYVARAFLDDSYVKLGESAGFGVGDAVPTTASFVRRFIPDPFIVSGGFQSAEIVADFQLRPRAAYRSTGLGTLAIRIPYEVGDRLLEVQVDVLGAPGGSANALFQIDFVGSFGVDAGVVGLLNDNNRDGSTTPWQSVAIPMSEQPVLGSESQLWLGLNASAAGYAIGSISARFDHPQT